MSRQNRRGASQNIDKAHITHIKKKPKKAPAKKPHSNDSLNNEEPVTSIKRCPFNMSCDNCMFFEENSCLIKEACKTIVNARR